MVYTGWDIELFNLSWLPRSCSFQGSASRGSESELGNLASATQPGPRSAAIEAPRGGVLGAGVWVGRLGSKDMLGERFWDKLLLLCGCSQN